MISPSELEQIWNCSSEIPVKAGDVLLPIGAMKMETAPHAERDGTIAEVPVRAGDQIGARDLPVAYARG